MISKTQVFKYLEDPKNLQLDIQAAAKLSSDLSREAKKLENRRIKASNDHEDLTTLKRNLNSKTKLVYKGHLIAATSDWRIEAITMPETTRAVKWYINAMDRKFYGGYLITDSGHEIWLGYNLPSMERILEIAAKWIIDGEQPPEVKHPRADEEVAEALQELHQELKAIR